MSIRIIPGTQSAHKPVAGEAVVVVLARPSPRHPPARALPIDSGCVRHPTAAIGEREFAIVSGGLAASVPLQHR